MDNDYLLGPDLKMSKKEITFFKATATALQLYRSLKVSLNVNVCVSVWGQFETTGCQIL